MKNRLDYLRNKSSEFIRRNFTKIIFLLFLLYFFDFSKNVPYLNLVFGDPIISAIVFYIAILLLFNLKARHTVIFTMTLLGVNAVINILTIDSPLSENLGNIVYGLMVLGLGQYLWDLRNKI
ncbi:MAG: hypothetical protein HYT08_01360 [Candidatus Levybacteria bacterium]|nr:hypothetical protein [Candidatus Levybacteria bacterium]